MNFSRYYTLCALLVSAAVLFLLPLQAQAQASLTEAAAGGAPAKGAPAYQAAPEAPVYTVATLTFYTDRPTFEAAFPGLPKEDFEEGQVGAGGVVGCNGPIDDTGTPGCFNAGDILPGVSFDSDNAANSQPRIALVGAGFLGASNTKNIVANFFIDAFVIDFTAGDVGATGMDLVCYFGADVVDVDVYGTSGLLGSTTANCNNDGSFFGVSADEIITQIVIYSPTNQAEGVDNICFGPGDSDGDGVPDAADLCPDTSIPEATVPSVRLGTNRWALVDDDFDFDTTAPKGNGPGRSYTTTDTGGCSCEQIIEATGVGQGHVKYGCSISVMDEWVAGVGASKRGDEAAPVAAELPEGFALSEAYPNPFNPQAQFTLALAEDQHVAIAVYDVLGRQVRTLHAGPLAAGQTHTFTFEAGTLPSGTYLIRAVGQTFQATRTVVLMK